jgi:hypothetical protein
MDRIKLILITVFACGALLGAGVYGAYERVKLIRNVGTLRAIGVEIYADQALTQILEEIAWGTLDPGETKSFNAWVKNTGNDMQKLVMWTENWNPTTAFDQINLAWNYNDAWIPVGDSIPVVFSLTVDPNVTGVTSFSFDIWVKGVH